MTFRVKYWSFVWHEIDYNNETDRSKLFQEKLLKLKQKPHDLSKHSCFRCEDFHQFNVTCHDNRLLLLHHWQTREFRPRAEERPSEEIFTNWHKHTSWWLFLSLCLNWDLRCRWTTAPSVALDSSSSSVRAADYPHNLQLLN